MKALSLLLAALLVGGCTTAPMVASHSIAEAKEAAQQYPAWLEMKPGYAEACMTGGGCIPMTQGELNQLASDIMQRTLQVCRRMPTI